MTVRAWATSRTCVREPVSEELWRARGRTHVNRCDPRVSVVDAVHTRRDGDGVQQSVLVSKQPSGANDGRSGVRLLDSLLSLVLGAVHGRLGVGCSVEMRDVDESIHSGVVCDLGHSSCSKNVHVVERVVPATRPWSAKSLGRGGEVHSLGLVVSSNQVVDDIRVTEALLNLRVVLDIPFLDTQRVSLAVGCRRGSGELTIGTICPRSPQTFKYLASSRSR